MIGCLIAGGLAVFAFSRIMHHRRWCAGGYGGWHRHHHGWHGGGWHGGWGGGPRGRFGEDWGPDNDVDGDAWFRGGDPWAGWGARNWGKRFFIRRVIDHVRATPEQERRIADAVREFRDEVKKTGDGEGRRSRQELAEALRRPTFDGVAMGEQFARHDTVIEGARKAYVGLVARIHDTLEPEQRGRLADLVDRGPRMGSLFGGWAR
jgi:Spy/CpxP family protein refolding chaperone